MTQRANLVGKPGHACKLFRFFAALPDINTTLSECWAVQCTYSVRGGASPRVFTRGVKVMHHSGIGGDFSQVFGGLRAHDPHATSLDVAFEGD